jgi:hypothetical protein
LEEEGLGTMPDQRLARRLNRSVKSVATRRAAKSIPIFNPKKHRWTPADDKLLSERPDAQIAALLGISKLAVKHRHHRLGIFLPGRKELPRPRPWQPGEDALLGTASDAQVAQRLERSTASVGRRRRLHFGMPPHGHRWTPKADALLGKMPDDRLARRLGCTVKAVLRRRERLGIPVWRVKFGNTESEALT